MLNTTKIKSIYEFLFIELADPRTNDWLFVKNPAGIFSIIFLYLYFVISWGPKFMKNRKPYEFNRTLIIYNFFQVLASTWIFVQGLDAAWLHYSFKCQPVDFSNSPEAIRVAQIVHIYFLVKITELLDTVFFVLRKKDKQLTFLHIYHHTGMPLISWGTTKYYPGGHCTLIGLINSFVHIIMYSYYMFAAMGPQYQKYLWWKRYITTMQLAQFCVVFLHSSQLLFIDCDYPKFTLFFTLPNSIFFYYLFDDFYKMAYEKKQVVKISDENNNVKLNGESMEVTKDDTNEKEGEMYHTKSE